MTVCNTGVVYLSSDTDKMVLVTAWLIVSWIHRIVWGEDTGDTRHKIQTRLDTVLAYRDTVTHRGDTQRVVTQRLHTVNKDTQRLNTVNRGNQRLGTTNKDTQRIDRKCKDTQSEVSALYKELESVKAVLEMKGEEVRRLRQELDKRKWWREDKQTMTEKEKSDGPYIW